MHAAGSCCQCTPLMVLLYVVCRWQAPMSFAADASTKEAAQIQASTILTRIEQAKNRGEVRPQCQPLVTRLFKKLCHMFRVEAAAQPLLLLQ